MSEKAEIPTEKGKFCLKIKKQMKLENNEQLARILKKDSSMTSEWIDAYEFRKTSQHARNASTTLVRATQGLETKEREKVIKYAEEKGIADWKIQKEFVPVYKKSDEPTKKALLSGKGVKGKPTLANLNTRETISKIANVN